MTNKTKKCSLVVLALIIIGIPLLFITACNDKPHDYDDGRLRHPDDELGVDSNTACFLNISYIPVLCERNHLVYHHVVDAYCTDGHPTNPTYVPRKYIRVNGEDMVPMGDGQKGQYQWGKTTDHPDILPSIKVEMDYFDEDIVFEQPLHRPIELIDPLPITVDTAKGLTLHYSGGTGDGSIIWFTIGYQENGLTKGVRDDGSGILVITPEELRELIALFLDPEYYFKFVQKTYNLDYAPSSIGCLGYTVNISRARKVKTNIGNGKNIFASIVQEDQDGILLKLKE